MIGCLTASFPRRPRHHFKIHGLEHMYANSMSLIDRCQKIAVEAHGPATFNRVYTVHDAIISYLQGVTNLYTLQRQPAMLYLKECLSIITTLGLHKSDQPRDTPNGLLSPRMTANGFDLEGPRPPGTDMVVQELGKRIFWVLFVSIKSLQQLGLSPFELSMPPPTRSDPYPSLPMEVDDVYLAPTHVLEQPEAHISELVGFNNNLKVLLSYQAVSVNEMVHGVDEVFDWEQQRKELRRSLDELKYILESRPPSPVAGQQGRPLIAQNHTYPEPGAAVGQPIDQTHTPINSIEDRVKMQQEVQKATIRVSQLGTRSYLVEKYLTLSDAHHHPIQAHRSLTHNSTNAIAPSLDSSQNTSPNEQPLPLENAVFTERETIIKELLSTLSTISQPYTEPNGVSLISKLRATTSSLLDTPHTRKGPLALRAEDKLNDFVTVLSKLEKAMPANGTPHDEDEESQLRAWAELREEQAQFLRSGLV